MRYWSRPVELLRFSRSGRRSGPHVRLLRCRQSDQHTAVIGISPIPIGRTPGFLSSAIRRLANSGAIPARDDTGTLVAALHTSGAVGPTGLGALGWRRLCTVFNQALVELCHSLAWVAKRLCTEPVWAVSCSAQQEGALKRCRLRRG